MAQNDHHELELVKRDMLIHCEKHNNTLGIKKNFKLKNMVSKIKINGKNKKQENIIQKGKKLDNIIKKGKKIENMSIKGKKLDHDLKK